MRLPIDYQEWARQLEEDIASGDADWQERRSELVRALEGIRTIAGLQRDGNQSQSLPIFPQRHFAESTYREAVEAVLRAATRPITVPEIADVIAATGKDIRKTVKTNVDQIVQRLREDRKLIGDVRGYRLAEKLLD